MTRHLPVRFTVLSKTQAEGPDVDLEGLYWSRILDMLPDDEAFAWDRLREASDKIGPAARLVAYKNTAAGYAIAAVHVAALREANVPYSIRPTDHDEYPFGIFVLTDSLNRAREIVGSAGLGSDIDWTA